MNGASVITAGRRVLERAAKEVQIKNGWAYFGPLGRVRVSELRRAGIPIGIRPGWRRFSEFKLLLMRADILTIINRTLLIERIVKEKRNSIPDDVYREIYLAANKVRFLALILLKDIDERLWNVQYALYDVL